MKRRDFILLGATAASSIFWPLAARAQQDDRVRALQSRILRLQAEAAADKISQFIGEIVSQMSWTMQLRWSAAALDQYRFDGVRLLRQVPAITEFAYLDSAGKEQLRMSRHSMDVVAAEADMSKEPKFTEAMAKKVYYGPVYFPRPSEPYITLSLAGARPDYGVSVAEVSLKFIWDLVTRMKVGERGVAYIVDGEGRVIAHRDISLLQRDFSSLAQVQAARAGTGAATEAGQFAKDIRGRDVLAGYAAVAPLGWLVFVEVPAEEVNALAR